MVAVIGWGRCWMARALSGNPLVRRVDRLEAAVALLAIMFAVIAIPFAVDFGHTAYTARAHRYAAEAAMRRPVDAIALSNSVSGDRPPSSSSVHVQWFADNETRDKVIRVPQSVAAGDHVRIWVNDKGDATLAPRTRADARVDAIVVAVAEWLALASLCAIAVALLRRLLDRARYRRWDRDFRLLIDVDDGGGKAARNT
jgi:hypothetical protein